MFAPIFPIYIPALAPLYPYAPLVWLGGVVGLWLTRYTHQLARRWGTGYYVLSALIRPAGVVLLAAGWLALYAPYGPGPHMLFGRPVGWLPRGNWLDWLWWAGIVLSCALDVWAILALGLRRSFLFRHVEDHLVTSGPYALVRHPQFLSTIALTFCSIRLFDPLAIRFGFPFPYRTLNANWVLLALSLWLLSILEERELVAHFGAAYRAYAQRVPRLWPTFPAFRADLARRLVELTADSDENGAFRRRARRERRGQEGASAFSARSAVNRSPILTIAHWASSLVQQVRARWGHTLYALARLAGLGLMVVACGTVVVAARQIAEWGGPAVYLQANQWADILCWLGTAGFLALGAWAVASAGLRHYLPWWPATEEKTRDEFTTKDTKNPSCPSWFSRLDPRAVTRGPFALVRHPEYLAAAGVTLLATRPFDPWPFSVAVLGRNYPFGAHWLPYVVALWLLAVVEDWALARKPGAPRLPRLIPN